MQRMVAVVLGLALLLGACARPAGDGSAAGGGPDDPVTSSPIGDDGGLQKSKPTPVEPKPGQADVFARGWDDVHVADDDRTLTIDFVGGVKPCSVLDHVDVEYGADAVTVTLFEGHDPDAGNVACIEIGVFYSVTIQLDEPLAGRKVKDGAPK